METEDICFVVNVNAQSIHQFFYSMVDGLPFQVEINEVVFLKGYVFFLSDFKVVVSPFVR